MAQVEFSRTERLPVYHIKGLLGLHLLDTVNNDIVDIFTSAANINDEEKPLLLCVKGTSVQVSNGMSANDIFHQWTTNEKQHKGCPECCKK